MRQRKNIQNLSEPERIGFRDAVQALIDELDPRSNYDHFANIHLHACVHGCELFLPWHRAFLLDYEDALRRVSGTDVTLPYWDWIGTPVIPDDFKVGPLDHRRDVGKTSRLPTRDEIDNALQISEFYRFGGARCSGIPNSGGDLERFHGFVHLWVGGDMADIERAAFDSIFWSHHANVDRLWARWQRTFGKDGPVDTATVLRALDTRRTATDVLDIGPNGLAYEYVEDVFSVAPDSGVLSAESRQIAEIGRVKTVFKRAEFRLHNLRLLRGYDAPTSIDVSMPGLQPAAKVSLFGLHGEDHHAHEVAGERHCHATTVSSSLDVSQPLLKTNSGEMQISVKLIGPQGTPDEGLRIACDRLELVLLPE